VATTPSGTACPNARHRSDGLKHPRQDHRHDKRWKRRGRGRQQPRGDLPARRAGRESGQPALHVGLGVEYDLCLPRQDREQDNGGDAVRLLRPGDATAVKGGEYDEPGDGRGDRVVAAQVPVQARADDGEHHD
jgi:hypothetical protein